MTSDKTRRVDVLQRETVFDRAIFKIEEIELRHELFSGSISDPLKRLLLERGEAAAVLLRDPSSDVVLLCEQFRVATIDHGSGWLVELPAGMIDQGETAESCARRETLEETGQEVHHLDLISTVYTSPGGSSERVHIFYGETSMPVHIGTTGGLVQEGEDIRVFTISSAQAIDMVRSGEILDAKTVIALQWLQLQDRTA